MIPDLIIGEYFQNSEKKIVTEKDGWKPARVWEKKKDQDPAA